MPALTTREAARERLLHTFMTVLERVIPADESQALRGRTFGEWEEQADEVREAVVATLLEERAALEDTAEVEAEALGCCPNCGSDRLYLQAHSLKREIHTPHGHVVLEHQSVRCRCCDRSFSPSGA